MVISLHNKNTTKQNTFKHRINSQENTHFNVTFKQSTYKWLFGQLNQITIIHKSMTSLNMSDTLIDDIQLTLTYIQTSLQSHCKHSSE